MPDFRDLVVHLSGIHVTDRNRRRAYAVAGHLIESALKERWHSTPDRQRQSLIRKSGDRLWNSYMGKRRNKEITPKEAAQEAIFDEETILEQELNPNDSRPKPLNRLNEL